MNMGVQFDKCAKLLFNKNDKSDGDRRNICIVPLSL